MKQLLLIFSTIFQLLSCSNDKKASHVLYEVPARTNLDSENYFAINRTKDSLYENESFRVNFSFSKIPFTYNGTGFIQNDVLFVKETDGKTVPLFDFKIEPCHSYRTINGNEMTFINKFKREQIEDSCYVYFLKLPYSVADADFQDKGLLFVGKKKGLLGISYVSLDSPKLEIVHFIGDSLLLDTKYIDSRCF